MNNRKLGSDFIENSLKRFTISHKHDIVPIRLRGYGTEYGLMWGEIAAHGI